MAKQPTKHSVKHSFLENGKLKFEETIFETPEAALVFAHSLTGHVKVLNYAGEVVLSKGFISGVVETYA